MTHVKSLIVACYNSSGLCTHTSGVLLSFVRVLQVLAELPYWPCCLYGTSPDAERYVKWL